MFLQVSDIAHETKQSSHPPETVCVVKNLRLCLNIICLGGFASIFPPLYKTVRELTKDGRTDQSEMTRIWNRLPALQSSASGWLLYSSHPHLICRTCKIKAIVQPAMKFLVLSNLYAFLNSYAVCGRWLSLPSPFHVLCWAPDDFVRF